MAKVVVGSMKHLLCRRGRALRGGYYNFLALLVANEIGVLNDVILVKKLYGTNKIVKKSRAMSAHNMRLW